MLIDADLRRPSQHTIHGLPRSPGLSNVLSDQVPFEMAVQKMADLVIDRALHGTAQNSWPRWADMVGLGSNGPV